ncbi:MAG: fumarylacetoacetate hydrolase family protein [Cellvibrionaceae bacterium]|nr:fumarylacetoacetate hydrolase family protein [Cellvibrionaceae bacterium]
MTNSVYNSPVIDGQPLNMRTNKIVCVGRNYSQHAMELNNPIPDSPLLFIKPSATLCRFSDTLSIPACLGLVHHELEISILLGKPLGPESTLDDINHSVLGVGLALDLTRRDLQHQLKEKGHPWERAKCFPGACPM